MQIGRGDRGDVEQVVQDGFEGDAASGGGEGLGPEAEASRCMTAN